jgi:hypothetical protein
MSGERTGFRLLALWAALSGLAGDAAAEDEAYLKWTRSQALEIAKPMRRTGRVGSFWASRGTHTERALNYRLRATWLTPDVIRATARLRQLDRLLTEAETRQLVEEAESAGDTVILIELDPNEGAGIVPRDWVALLRGKAASGAASKGVRGTSRPHLKEVSALAGIEKRDYAYEAFWVVFPLLDPETGDPLLPVETVEAELVVRIGLQEGRVSWRIPDSIHRRAQSLAVGRTGANIGR